MRSIVFDGYNLALAYLRIAYATRTFPVLFRMTQFDRVLI